MLKMKGPAALIVQFMRPEPPFDTLENLAKYFSDIGYVGLQIPSWVPEVFDLDTASESKSYCDDFKATLKKYNMDVTELYNLQGQMLAMHECYEDLFGGFYPKGLNSKQRVEWATGELKKLIKASANMGTKVIPGLSGGIGWHMVYPWPQRPAGIVDDIFAEFARLWRPLLDMAADNGVCFAYELHPGQDLFDGATFEKFLEVTDNHPAVAINYDPSHFILQQLDYLDFIKRYGDRIKAFHVKGAEYKPTGRCGVYGGYLGWMERAGRFRTAGSGDTDWKSVFTLLAEADFDGWCVLEWEDPLKSQTQGAIEGYELIKKNMIDVAEVAFDDFLDAKPDANFNKKVLGLD